MLIRFGTLGALAASLLTITTAHAEDGPLKDCPIKEPLRFAKAHGGLYDLAGKLPELVLPIDGSIPVYGPLEGKCQKIPNPGTLGAVKVSAGGRDYVLTASATLNHRRPYGNEAASKMVEAAVVASFKDAGGEAQWFHLIYGEAGSADAGVRSTLLQLQDGRSIEGHRYNLMLSVKDETGER